MAFRLGCPQTLITAAGPFRICTGFPVFGPLNTKEPITNATVHHYIAPQRSSIPSNWAAVKLAAEHCAAPAAANPFDLPRAALEAWRLSRS